MHQNLNDITFLVGNKKDLSQIKSISVFKIFDNVIIDFLADLSKYLLNDKSIKKYPDIIAYAFWIRRVSLEKEANNYNKEERLGRGVAFHIAPSNIPVQFAVSLVYALLSGNASIIRVSEKNFEQVNILCEVINKILTRDYKMLIPYINIIRYKHNEEITSYLTSICDARIIWGGNDTISYMNKIPVPPRAVELKFADRYSIMVIDSDSYLKMDKNVIANDFYMDTYWVDQNACSSPRIIIWTGKKVEEAKNIFWNLIQEIVEQKYEYKDIAGSEKLLKFTLLAAKDKNIRMKKKNNKLIRVEVEKLYPELLEYKGNSGYFLEYTAKNIIEILPIIIKQCQTIICCGIDKNSVKKMVIENGVYGCDRIVDVGHALDLSFKWDGYDIIRELSRIIL